MTAAAVVAGRAGRARYRLRLEAARQAGQLPDDLDDHTLLDLAFGPLWFRVLTRPATVDDAFAREVARLVTAAIGVRAPVTAPGSAPSG